MEDVTQEGLRGSLREDLDGGCDAGGGLRSSLIGDLGGGCDAGGIERQFKRRFGWRM